MFYKGAPEGPEGTEVTLHDTDSPSTHPFKEAIVDIYGILVDANS